MSSMRIFYNVKNAEDQQKLLGDRQFKAGKFEDAIKSYSGALSKNPTNYKLLMDRAMCYENMNQWDLFILDWRRAMDIKAQMLYASGLMLGAGVLKSNDFEEASQYFDSVRGLARRQIERNSREFSERLQRTRKSRWLDFESNEVEREKQMLKHMSRLLKSEKRSSLSKLKKKNLSDEELQSEKQEIKRECDDHRKELSNIFNKLKDRRKKREIPEYLFCPITYELFKDPVITPSGITYERQSIEKHLKDCGAFDPLTRTELTADKLIPNRAILNTVDAFLANNEWARYE